MPESITIGGIEVPTDVLERVGLSASFYQVGDELYARNDLDRGHLARRADLIWGSLPVAKKANTGSFYFTNLNQLEALELDEFRVFQTSLTEIEERTGLRFPDVMREADPVAVPEELDKQEPLGSVNDIRW